MDNDKWKFNYDNMSMISIIGDKNGTSRNYRE